MTNPADLEAFLRGIRQKDPLIYVPPGLRYRNDSTVSYKWFPVDRSSPDKVHSEIGEFLRGKRPVTVDYYPPQRVLVDNDSSIQGSFPQEEGFAVYCIKSN